MVEGLPGHASSNTARGTCRAAYRKARATTTTSSSGPITGRNSGIRSIGDSTHNRANPTATFARRGTAHRRATAVPWSHSPEETRQAP